MIAQSPADQAHPKDRRQVNGPRTVEDAPWNVCARILIRRGTVCGLERSFIAETLSFYKAQNGAHVGHLFMSLIHTGQFSSANPFDYLTELQRYSDAVSRCPTEWMPWNYRSAIGFISCQD